MFAYPLHEHENLEDIIVNDLKSLNLCNRFKSDFLWPQWLLGVIS